MAAARPNFPSFAERLCQMRGEPSNDCVPCAVRPITAERARCPGCGLTNSGVSSSSGELQSLRVDLAIRARHLEDSNLVAFRISSNPLSLAAAPSYLENPGKLEKPADLSAHQCVAFSRMKSAQTWRFTKGEEIEEVKINSGLMADQGDTLVEYAAAGAGVVMMTEWVMSEHLKSGRLVRLLPEWSPPDIPLHIVYTASAVVPLRIRLLTSFIRRNVRARNLLPR